MRRLPLLPDSEAPGPAAAGTRIKQCGRVHTSVLGGWLLDRAADEPRLVTVAHVLAPRPELFARPIQAPPLPPALRYTADGAHLCIAGGSVPVARVTAAGVCDPFGRVASLDVAVAAPLHRALVPEGAVPARVASARLGQRVRVAIGAESSRAGTVAAIGWSSGHYGTGGDVLIAPAGAEPFSSMGMSGAWICDAASGDPVAMLVGELLGVTIDGTRHERLACAHPLDRVLDLFELSTARG